MNNAIESKKVFWDNVVERINNMREQGITPMDSDEAEEIFNNDMQEIDSIWFHADESDESIYDDWIEYMDEVFTVMMAV